MDKIHKEIIAAKLGALLEYAIPLAKAKAELALAALETEGAEELTLEEVTALGEELFFLQIQTQDVHEAVSEWEATFPEQLAEVEDLGELTVDEFTVLLNSLGFVVTDAAPESEVEAPSVFRTFLETLEGPDA